MRTIKSVSLFAILLIAFVLMSGTAIAADPIEIGSVDDLKKIGNDIAFPLGGDYVLINDIIITDSTWNSIGDRNNRFVGTFDGQGHSIIFASLTGTTTLKNFDGGNREPDGFGLFGTVGNPSSADRIEIKNVNIVLESNLTNEANSVYYNWIGSLVGYVHVSSPAKFLMNNSSLTSNGNFEIKGKNHVGGLIGHADYGIFKDCSVSGDVSITAENNGVGGFVGHVSDGIFENCSVSGDVSVTAKNHAGGLIGYVPTYVNFTKCFVSGDVSVTAENDYAGGLVGYTLRAADFTNCFVSGDVSVTAENAYAGGFISYFGSGLIKDCYSAAQVKAVNEYAGGLVGYAAVVGYGYSPVTIKSSYFAGTVDSRDKLGGILGDYYYIAPTVTDCIYLDTSGSGFTNSFGTPVSSANMMKIETYETGGSVSTAWSISNSPNPSKIWYIRENLAYPQLFALRSNTIPIPSVAELKKIGSNEYDFVNDYWYTMDADYILVDDIVITDANWSPIGSLSNPFIGTLEGNGFTISDLKIDLPSNECVGLFGVVSDASFSNISLIDADVKGKLYVGGLIGRASNNVDFINCSISDDVTVVAEERHVGGFVGRAYNNISFSNCSVSGDVSVNGVYYVGSFTGYVNNYAVFSNCSVSDNVSLFSDNNMVGGLAGYVSKGNFSNCSVSDNVSVITMCDYAGGLVGYADSSSNFARCSVSDGVSVTAERADSGGLAGGLAGSVKDCYSAAQVKAGNRSGGLVGTVTTSTEIKSSYFAGTASLISGTNSGGIIGNYFGIPIITDCFYVETAGTGFTNSFGTPASSADMKKIETYQTPNVVTNWDIVPAFDTNHVWFIIEDQTYPLLSSIDLAPGPGPGPAPGPNTGGGSGTGQAKVNDSTPSSAGPILNESPGQGFTNENLSSNNGSEIIYPDEEGGSVQMSYLLILIFLIIIISCIVYFWNKNRE
ncbi:hypothetical protein MmiEs2_16190 [Methanimicrococcus stummii]|uniref:GLUG domain-containing protein n=1 Tax=Methanimicrococcus stummii TaxID=3028294 RepID=A0AA96ZZK9_9EURY|nr:GLUG motif-containing protein [Methanimicrococcus sp. Es2]WNY29392.1 hypothetical protein MmiEs2_16190 [Methanimicrococcus sp. Es2]